LRRFRRLQIHHANEDLLGVLEGELTLTRSTGACTPPSAG
jgi:hypothetical protein